MLGMFMVIWDTRGKWIGKRLQENDTRRFVNSVLFIPDKIVNGMGDLVLLSCGPVVSGRIACRAGLDCLWLGLLALVETVDWFVG